MTLAAGDAVGRYTIEKLLGEGGMGQVYRAYDDRLHRRVALKIVRGGARDAEASARLIREARAAAALDHPNAIAIFDVGEAGGETFIAMELVEGRPLSAYVGSDDPSVATRVAWLADVARALSAAHRRGLVHRDIKPANVMVRDDGVVKVLDFGIARRTRFALPAEETTRSGAPSVLEFTAAATGEDLRAQTLATLTQAGSVAGTPLYMAPEQMRCEEVDARADQFSWGVLAYELLCGRRPWGDTPSLETFAAILSAPPVPLVARAPEVPATIAAVIERALAKSKGDRHASMDDVVRALDRKAGASAAPRPVAASEQADTPTTRLTADIGTPADAPARRAPGLGNLAVGAASVALLAAVALALRANARAPASYAQAASASSLASAAATAGPPKPVRVVDLPPPASSSQDALDDYRLGLEAERDGSVVTARKWFTAATTTDGDLAAAWLRLSTNDIFSHGAANARDAFRHASALRARLDAHDQTILDAFEPVVLEDPMDWDAHLAKLKAGAQRFPVDAEIRTHLAYAQLRMGLTDDAIASYERVLTLDPAAADAYETKGRLQAKVGDVDAALATVDACEAAVPSSAACARLRIPLAEQRGDCAAMEAAAREFALKNAEGSAYWVLAQALASQDRPAASVHEALDLYWQKMPPCEPCSLEHEMVFSLWQGDFVSAERFAKKLDAVNAKDEDEEKHASPAGALVDVYTETGRLGDARKVAEQFLARRASWVFHAGYTGSGLAHTSVAYMLLAVRQGGGAPADFEAARDQFVSFWLGHLPDASKNALWLPAYAAIATTPDDGREALAALPRFSPLPTWWTATMWTAAIGRVRLLAGDPDGALPLLQRGSAVCLALSNPVERVRARLDLGRAREALGDHDGACRDYAWVAARWGNAKPRSATADSARDRMKALGCGG
jgi:serine/threonine-protein kinase